MNSYGFHAGTVFAYGVTSSGKTHTMHVRQHLSSTFIFFLFMINLHIFFLSSHVMLHKVIKR